MKCLACEKMGKIVEFEKACSLGTHLWKTHDLKPRQYYDQYLAKPGDGKCAECGASTTFRTIGQGYMEFCSKKCAARHIAADPERNAHKCAEYVNTMQREYGVNNCAQIDSIKENRKTTMKERYGVEYYSQTEEHVKKTYDTNLKRYGVHTYIALPEFQAKLRAANMALIGVPYRFCLRTEEAKKTYTEYLDKHGCDLVEFIDKKHITYRCRKCGHETTEQDLFLKVREAHGLDFCTKCCPKSSPVSGEEMEVRDFIESLGFETKHYDRGFLDQYGADVVIESKKVIIEFDGLTWHSEKYVPPEYHLKKTEIAERMGYRLVHIFSDEWEEKRPIVESRLCNLLSVGGMPVNARECTVEKVSHEDAKAFIEVNHVQGDVPSAVRYGLYKDGVLYAIMTFCMARYEKTGWEMLRYCGKSGYSIRGGAGKLLKRFIEEYNPNQIVTYADRRWSGKEAFYDKMGFVLDGTSEPGYSYIVNNRRVSRIQYQKHILVEQGYDASLSEHEIMYTRGIYRIYDCGNLRYVWKRSGQLDELFGK